MPASTGSTKPAAKPKKMPCCARAWQTSAAAAVNKLAARLSAGSDRLADTFAKTRTLAAEFGKVVEGKSRIRFELHVH
jgi:hypothetical protein